MVEGLPVEAAAPLDVLGNANLDAAMAAILSAAVLLERQRLIVVGAVPGPHYF